MLLLILSFLSALLYGAHAKLNANSTTNIALYWGQNSYGESDGPLAQQRLSFYCADPNVDIMNLSFLLRVVGNEGHPELNFAAQGSENCTFGSDPNGDDLAFTNTFSCSQVAEDIKSCQQDHGTTILLSVGGATYSEGGFCTAEEAQAAADNLWSTFGPLLPNATESQYRPFGTAALDGFDMDFESRFTQSVPFAQRLRDRMDAQTSVDGKPRYLTAAPQCPYPDASDDAMLNGPNGDGNGAVPFDAVFVQYYNNYCGDQSFAKCTTEQPSFNFDTWDTWASNTSANPRVKVLLGIPAGITAAGSGYKSARDLRFIFDYLKSFASFGGVAMFDASQANANGGFLPQVASGLNAVAAGQRKRDEL
ncbi:glycoside hydrolase family 18 protein [Saccharata proteae CBS 121410]|uniref:chitinase n=1 Tax=Saccharata proteae CBS 121410 TaxID=1314787 RepID=A0A9P4I2Z5_9PEZI|nr:glycoside hydrolase family 18 protein [Saccharata proteae CBS 121410]